MDSDPYRQAVDFSRKRLHRVFLDGRRELNLGGRFYGAWYQGVPKEYRKDILINGFPTMESDFSGYHQNMLYALNTIVPPGDEVHSLDGYPSTKAFRKFLKGFLLMIVNSTNPASAITAIRYQRARDKTKAERWGRTYEALGIEPLRWTSNISWSS